MSHKKNIGKERGFTIIELLIVVVIITTLSVALIFNFRLSAQNKTARLQVASVIVSDLRRAETMALSGSRFQGNIVCGYGLHYVDSADYLFYAKTAPGGGQPCSAVATRNYNSSSDYAVETKKIFNPGIEIRSAFSDIFFEPPNPAVYINNDSSLTRAAEQIIVQLKGQVDCVGQPCTYVKMYTSGELDII